MLPRRSTLRSAASFDLNTLDSGGSFNYNATLSGNFVSAVAHNRTTTADTLIATGRNSTLLGGAGKDRLVALGSNNFLASGSGAATLIGTTLRGASTTLQGNGRSSLLGNAGNDVFIVSEGDRIGSLTLPSGVTVGNDMIRTAINNFSLTDTVRRGDGVVNIQNLIYTGLGGATLTGNARNGSLVGSTLAANSLVAGTFGGGGAQTLVGGVGNDILRGNGKSLLIGGAGSDTYIVSQSGSGSSATFDKVVESTNAGTDTVRTTLSGFNLADTGRFGAGIINVERLIYDGPAGATLTGNILNNIITGGGGNDLLSSGGGRDSLVGGGGNDTLYGNRLSTLNGGTGSNTYYVISQEDVIQDAGSGGSVIGLNSGPAAFRYDLSNSGQQTSGMTRLQYMGASAATLVGNANKNTIIGGLGTNSLVSGTGGASLVGNSRSDTLVDTDNTASTMAGGLGNDFYYLNNLNSQIEESPGITGGIDTILVSTGTSFDLSQSNWANGTGIENLTYGGVADFSMTGNSNANLLDARNASNATLRGTSDNNTLLSAGSDTLLGSQDGSNLFLFGNAADLAISSIVGGNVSDTLDISGPADISDDSFQKMESVDVVRLNAQSSIELGIKAQTSGLATLHGSDQGDSVTLDEEFTSPLTLIGGNGDDFYSFADPIQLAANSLSGGNGTDTLEIGGGGILDEASFLQMQGIDVLRVLEATKILMGTTSSVSGISSLIGSDAIDGDYFAGFNVRGLLMEGNNGDDTLQGFGSIAKSVTDTLTGGFGADLFVIGNADGNAYTSEGDDDYALITDFNPNGGDRLQLFGERSYYTASTTGTSTEIYFSPNPGTIPDDRIAILNNVTGFNLATDATYVPA
jgi:serralysin